MPNSKCPLRGPPKDILFVTIVIFQAINFITVTSIVGALTDGVGSQDQQEVFKLPALC